MADNNPSQQFDFKFIAIFAITFFGLEGLYHGFRQSFVEPILIHKVTVIPSAWLLNLIDNSINVVASEAKLISSQVKLSVLHGCEGFEVIMMLVAAIFAAKASWGQKIWAALVGSVMVFMLNQVRIIVLFYAARDDKDLFNMIHGVAGPLVIVFLVGLFFYIWQQRQLKAHRQMAAA